MVAYFPTAKPLQLRRPLSTSHLIEMVPIQAMGEMVLDGGGRFNPAGIDGFLTLSLLLAFLVAHDRATEDNHTRTEKEHKISEHTAWVL